MAIKKQDQDSPTGQRFRFGGLKFDIPNFLLTEMVADCLAQGTYEKLEIFSVRKLGPVDVQDSQMG